ncbi:MAG: dihydroorotase, partial [Candidatus Brocadiia bacterium]|nr:dihydroorotase [Candidatus Brocadiia bacterium]
RGRAVQVIDATGLWLWPGLVDIHVHFREPGFTRKETIASGCAAALRGGYTSVVCEPNTTPPLDSAELAMELHDRAEAAGPVRVYFKAAMTRGRAGKEAGDFESLAACPNVVALSDDGDPVTDAALMEEICRGAAAAGLPLSPHCEDSRRALDDYGAGAQPGFEIGPPYHNEANYIARDLALAARTGCRVHFSHVSLARSVELIEQYRASGRSGADVTFEVAPHHLLLCESDYEPGAVPTVCPPLRTAEDRDALRECLARAAPDAVASDHAPHTREDMERGATGLIGLETTLGLMLTHFVHTGALSPVEAAGLLSTRPARVLRLLAGSLAVGQLADMVFIDPDEEWTVRADEFASLSRNTPYGGWPLRGMAVAVAVGGNVVFRRPSFDDRMGRGT